MNNRKKEQGITLIALAVTIIVLLIVAGITISAILGTDGIINGANESKNKTAVVEEKQILNTSVAASIGKSPKAKVEEANLKNYCNQNIGEEDKDYTLEKEDKHFNLKFSSTGNEYVILEDGTILTKQEYNSKIEKEQKGQIIIEVGTKEKVTVETESESVVDWKSKDESVAKVSIENVKNVKEAEILGIKNGETTVTATLKNGEKVQYDVVVQTSPKSIALNENNITLDLSIDPQKQLVVSYDPVTTNVNKKITWTSSDTKVATVDSNGIVKGVKNGKDVIITATTENGKTATCKVTVQTTPISVTLNKTNVTLDLSTNKTVQLTATVNPSTANVQNGITWSSNDTSKATVSQSGLVTGVKNGSTTITATTENGKTVTCTVTVVTSPTGIALDKDKVVLDMSGTKTASLNVIIQPSNANKNIEITWKSKNSEIASVDQSGNVIAKANGTTIITATTKNGKSASCTITVTTSITSLIVSPTSKTLKKDENVQLVAIKNPSTATEGIVWTSSNQSVATVNQNGLVIAKGSGTATITVKSSTGSKSANCTIKVEAGIAPVDPNNATDVTFSTEYGKIDIIWLDNNNNVISTPSAPILTSNGESMTPIIWDSEYKIIKTTSNNSEWYDYSQKKWANAITANGSYFVWIPRYAYRITYYSDSNYENITGYYDGYGQWCATTKKLRYKIEDGIKTKEYNGMKYIVHPAFCSDVNYGGFGKEISGFWVAKFKISSSAHDAMGDYGMHGDLQSVPGEWIGYKETPGGFYKMARNATFGYTGEKDPIDGYTSYMNSHMAKNSEWGAIVYLTHSKFGKDGINNMSKGLAFYSGGGSSGHSKYNWKRNISISTTGNVYGIYDMKQETNEVVAVFAQEVDKYYMKRYGWTELNTSLESTKYATKYKNPKKAKKGNKTLFNYSITGDAIKEINTGGIDSILSETYHVSWFEESATQFVYSSSPFSYRIEFYGSFYSNGSAAVVENFRDILVP